MPVTPFHAGPGLILKAFLRDRFSLTLFLATQVVIDLESLFFLTAGTWPVHRAFHTLPGALGLSLVVALAARPLAQAFLRRLAAELGPSKPPWLDLDSRITLSAAAVSGALGAICQVLPDAVMHPDVLPLSPWLHTNPIFRLFSSPTLHLAMLGCGVVGGGWLVLARTPRRVA